MNNTSGIGIWYGFTNSDGYVLEDLLKDQGYDLDGYDQEDIDAVRSAVARLPATMADERSSWVYYTDAEIAAMYGL